MPNSPNPTDKYSTKQWASLGHAVVSARHMSDKALDNAFARWDKAWKRPAGKDGRFPPMTTKRWFAHSMLLTYGTEIAFRKLGAS